MRGLVPAAAIAAFVSFFPSAGSAQSTPKPRSGVVVHKLSGNDGVFRAPDLTSSIPTLGSGGPEAPAMTGSEALAAPSVDGPKGMTVRGVDAQSVTAPSATTPPGAMVRPTVTGTPDLTVPPLEVGSAGAPRLTSEEDVARDIASTNVMLRERADARAVRKSARTGSRRAAITRAPDVEGAVHVAPTGPAPVRVRGAERTVDAACPSDGDIEKMLSPACLGTLRDVLKPLAPLGAVVAVPLSVRPSPVRPSVASAPLLTGGGVRCTVAVFRDGPGDRTRPVDLPDVGVARVPRDGRPDELRHPRNLEHPGRGSGERTGGRDLQAQRSGRAVRALRIAARRDLTHSVSRTRTPPAPRASSRAPCPPPAPRPPRAPPARSPRRRRTSARPPGARSARRVLREPRRARP